MAKSIPSGEADFFNWQAKLVETAEKDMTKAIYVVLLRMLVLHIKSMPNVTEKILTDLGLAFGKSSGHPGPAPDTIPDLETGVALEYDITSSLTGTVTSGKTYNVISSFFPASGDYNIAMEPYGKMALVGVVAVYLGGDGIFSFNESQHGMSNIVSGMAASVRCVKP